MTRKIRTICVATIIMAGCPGDDTTDSSTTKPPAKEDENKLPESPGTTGVPVESTTTSTTGDVTKKS